MADQRVYTIELDRSVVKQLRRLPRDLVERIAKAIDDLRTNPRPIGCKRLVGFDQVYRLRVGDWRIILEPGSDYRDNAPPIDLNRPASFSSRLTPDEH